MPHAAEAKPPAFDESYYQANYPNYERQNPARKLSYYGGLVWRYAATGVPRRIHDVGCAFGKFLESLGPDWEAFGSDLSEFAIRDASRRVPWGRFAVRGADAIPAEGPFGVVTAFDVAEHVPDLDAFADGVRKQLVPGGWFLFVVPVYDGLTGPVVRLLDKDPTHLHKWPRQQWIDWAGKHFELIHWEGVLRYLLPWGQYLHVPSRWFRRHTPAIVMVCRRR